MVFDPQWISPRSNLALFTFFFIIFEIKVFLFLQFLL